MNRSIILLAVFLVFVTLKSTESTPLLRRDELSGYKNCDGNFPVEITSYSYSPNPMVAGQSIHHYFTGKGKVTIEQGALLNITGYHMNQQAFNHEIGFCQSFVEYSGHTCPFTSSGKSDFSLTGIIPIESDPSDPKNVTIEYGLTSYVSNPDGQVLFCLVGKFKLYLP